MNETDLRPGDVIMSFGKTPLSRAVKEITGSRFSHAALWTGERVLESTLPRTEEVSLAELAEKTFYMHVFRYCKVDGRGALVVANARGYIGRPYNVSELVIGGAIGTLTAWLHQKNDWLAYNAQFEAKRVLALLNRLLPLFAASAAEGVTCVELVVLAHLRADLPIVVQLDPGGKVDVDMLWKAIQDMRSRTAALAPPDAAQGVAAPNERPDELEELRDLALGAAETSRLIREAGGSPEARATSAALETPLSVLKALELRVSDRWDEPNTWYAGLVTPAQLENSPSLEDLGPLIATP